MKNIAVFLGGESVEHDISIITGVMTVNSIDKEKFTPLPIYISNEGEWYTGESLFDLDEYKKLNLKKLKKVTLISGNNALYAVKGKKLKQIAVIACALNCLHGERGEDGCLAGLLNMCKIPIASPPMLPSAVSIDKNFTKTVMRALKVKTLDGVVVKGATGIEEANKNISYPVIVKPNKLGSSIGVSRAKNEQELESALSYAMRFGENVLVEPCLEDFIEINCAAYRSADGSVRVSECERPIGASKLLSFDDKYESGSRVFPADIDKKISDKIKNITKKIYASMGFNGVIRIDFFVVGKEVYLNEINTVPGSLAYYLFCDTLKEFSAMLTELIEVALKDFAKEQTTVKSFNSGILAFSGGKSCKRL